MDPLDRLWDEAEQRYGKGVAIELHRMCRGWCAKVWPKEASDFPIISAEGERKAQAISNLRKAILAKS